MIVMPTILFGQTFLSCNLKEYCAWNEVTEAWEMDCDPFENNCLFEMNEDETMFVHTTSEMKSTYYIKEKVSGEDGLFRYNVISDVGNEYHYLFDIKHKEVKTMIEDENGNSLLVRWYVKAVF